MVAPLTIFDTKGIANRRERVQTAVEAGKQFRG
jgi:hypothetical protein